MIKRFKVLTPTILLVISSFFSSNVSASHSVNMEMFYRHVSDSTYEFTLIFYRNCVGFSAGAPAVMYISAQAPSKSLGTTFICKLMPTTGTGVPPLQPPNIYNCLDTSLCVQEYVYRGNWTSPGRATDWKFSSKFCCIPNGVVAPTNIQYNYLYIEAGLDNLTFPDTLNKNLSPIFHNRRPNHPGRTSDTIYNPPHVSICQSRNVLIDQAVKEYNGDSVAYEFIIPQTNGGVNQTYINSYSFANPLPSLSGPIVMDSIKGSFRFTPGIPFLNGIYYIGIKATEYRDDTTVSGGVFTVKKKEIGYVTRNLVIVINDSLTCRDETFTFTDTAGTGVDTNLIVLDCPYTTFDIGLTDFLVCSSVDINASCLQLRHPATNTIIPLKSIERMDCSAGKLSKRMRIHLDSAISADTFELVFKRGSDGNTILSECFMELVPYADTLTIIFQDQKIGRILGDKISPRNFNSFIELECSDTNIIVNLSLPVLCNSIATDGSDFILKSISSTVPVTVNIKKAEFNCIASRTDSIVLTADSIIGGTYLLMLKPGSDTNTLYNICGTEWPADSILLVSHGLKPNLGPDTVYCREDSNFMMTLYAGVYDHYLWSSRDTLSFKTINDTGTYIVAVSNKYGCVGIDSFIVESRLCYVGIDENSDSEIIIYPNPSNGEIHLQIPIITGQETVRIFSIQGKEVYKLPQERLSEYTTIDLSAFQDGMYILEVKRNAEILIQEKIILKTN